MLAALSPQVLTGNLFIFEKSFTYLIKRKEEISKEDLYRFRDSQDLAFKSTLSGGLVGFLVGAALVMMNIDDKSAIGPGLSTAIISATYGLFFSFLFFLPLFTRFKNEILGYERLKDDEDSSSWIFMVAGMIMPFMFITLCIIFAKGSLIALIFMPDIVVLILFISATLFISNGLIPFVDGLKLILMKGVSTARVSIAVMVNIFSMLVKVSIGSGVVLFFMNIVAAMVKLESKEMIYYKSGQIMMPIIYGLIFGMFIFYPVKKALDRKLATIILKM